MGGLLNWCTCRGTSPSRRPRFINISLIMFTYWGVKMCLQSTVYRAKVRTCDNDLGSVCWAQYYVSVSFRKWRAFIQCKGQIFYAVGIHVTVSHLEKKLLFSRQGLIFLELRCLVRSPEGMKLPHMSTPKSKTMHSHTTTCCAVLSVSEWEDKTCVCHSLSFLSELVVGHCFCQCVAIIN